LEEEKCRVFGDAIKEYSFLNDRVEVENNENCEACEVTGEYDATSGRNAPNVDARTVLRASCLYEERHLSKIVMK